MIDKESQIHQSVIKKIIRRASADYYRNTGIRLKLVKFQLTSLNTLYPRLFLREFRAEGGLADIVAVFTNKARVIHMRLPGRQLGYAEEDWGVVWNYEVTSRLRLKHCYLNTYTVFEHEIAHLFLVQHNDTERGSFMNAHSKRCYKNWPKELKGTVLKNKYRTLNPFQ